MTEPGDHPQRLYMEGLWTRADGDPWLQHRVLQIADVCLGHCLEQISEYATIPPSTDPMTIACLAHIRTLEQVCRRFIAEHPANTFTDDAALARWAGDGRD